MSTNGPIQETDLLDAAVYWLRSRLPSTWEVGKANRIFTSSNPPQARSLEDGAMDIRSNQGTQTTLAVEAKRSFSPRDVERILPGLSQTLRTLAGNVPLLVVAPWLSKRTQELLTQEGINYIDLTGNARISLEYPTLFLETVGAERDPWPLPRPLANVRGPKAARLIRFLIDVAPPYGVREIATLTELNAGYVSKLLEALDAEALVDRTGRGRVENVNISSLITRWADSYDVFTSNRAVRFVAPQGAGSVLDKLRSTPLTLIVTGSFAAVTRAPVAAPSLLIAYTDTPESAGQDLNLLPSNEGANVVLLAPFDRVVWQRTVVIGGVRYAALSQTAVDCLTGNGRMPAEGEALIDWMIDNAERWRVPTIDDVPKDRFDG